MIECLVDMRGFFQERLTVALKHQQMSVSPVAEVYLVNLLTGYASVPAHEAFGKSLVERLAEAADAPTTTEQLRLYRDMGDSALYLCGFCADHLDRRGVNRGYVVAMGGRAYGAAAELSTRLLSGSLGEVFPELADKFDVLARVLDEVRETTSLRTPQDIVRLYERWRKTGSPLLAARLEEEGVFPQRVPAGNLH